MSFKEAEHSYIYYSAFRYSIQSTVLPWRLLIAVNGKTQGFKILHIQVQFKGDLFFEAVKQTVGKFFTMIIIPNQHWRQFKMFTRVNIGPQL